MAGSMVLAASTAAGSIDNDVGGRVTIDGDGGGRWRWWLREVGVVSVVFLARVYLPT